MKLWIYAVLCICVMTFRCATCYAQEGIFQRIEALEKRFSALEAKIDALQASVAALGPVTMPRQSAPAVPADCSAGSCGQGFYYQSSDSAGSCENSQRMGLFARFRARRGR